MSCLISLNNITFSYNLETILEDIQFSINEKEKIAIAGHNGSGKSTLLHLLSGKLKEFNGSRSIKNGLRFEIVEQYLNPELRELTLLEALLDKIPKDEHQSLQYKAEMLLEELYFSQSEFTTFVKDLSGGGQNRLMFARAIINAPDLVFMDEPTNHLDLKSLLYIESYIQNKSNFAAVIISHDKSFLKNVSNKTVILRDKSAYSYDLSYGEALKELKISDEIARKRLDLEEKEISRIKKSAKRLAIWGREHDNEDLAKKSKSMLKRATKLEENKTFVSHGNPYELNLSFEKISSKFAIQIENSSIHYGEKLFGDQSNKLFEIENFSIKSGEKVALLGANGVGKSTFIDTIVKNLENDLFTCNFKAAPNIQYGLFDQEQMVLNPNINLHNEVSRLTGADDITVKNTLIRAGFKFHRHCVLIKTLSGGEKSRIIFCVLYLKRPNFMVLDEPTNHIDLDGKEELAKALKDSSITALITGHDRSFIEEVADRYILITNGRLFEIESPDFFYKDLLSHKKHDLPLNQDPIEIEQRGTLELILELEEKLAADLKRKPKFQKIKLQEKWRKEITDLYKKI